MIGGGSQDVAAHNESQPVEVEVVLLIPCQESPCPHEGLELARHRDVESKKIAHRIRLDQIVIEIHIEVPLLTRVMCQDQSGPVPIEASLEDCHVPPREYCEPVFVPVLSHREPVAARQLYLS